MTRNCSLRAEDEDSRLAALRRYAILDTEAEAAFDRIVRVAARLLKVPIALVSLVDMERQWFKAKIGLAASETSREIAFCNWAIQSTDVFVVSDATDDPRFSDNPLVTGSPGIRFYAGAPLRSPDGFAIGTLCVMDTQPRPEFTSEDGAALADLAAAVMDALELRRELAAKREDARRTALREQLLGIVADAPDFGVAIETVMAALRNATDGLLCLFYRLGVDGRHLHLVGAQGRDPFFNPGDLATLRGLDVTLENALVGRAIAAGEQLILDQATPESLEIYPAMRLSVARGMHAQIATPISLREERYGLTLGFGPGERDLAATGAMLLDVVSAIRPLLRRLRDAEEIELFRRVVEASNDGVIITEADQSDAAGTCIRYVNEAFLRQTGYPREAVIGQSPQMLQGPETSTEARRNIRLAMEQSRPICQEILNYRRDGSTFWTELNIAPVANAAGGHSHWVAIQRNTTLRHDEEVLLAANESAFRQLFEKHPAPMWVYDPETLAFLEVNEAAVAKYGWSRETFLQMSILDIRPEEEREAIRALTKRHDGARTVSGPWQHRTASGEIRLVQVLSRTMDFKGRAGRLVVIWDVTDRVHAETVARDLANRLHVTFESISDGLYTLDHDFRFTFLNSNAERLLQRRADDLIGKVVWSEFPGSAETDAFPNFNHAIATNETVRFTVFYSPMLTWFDISAFPSPEGLTVYFRDVTAQHQHEERLRLLEAAVDKANDIVVITEAEPIDVPGPRIVYVNDAFVRRTGFSRADAIGQSPRILQGPLTQRTELDRIRAALAAWEPVRAELINYTKDGQQYWLELDIFPIADATGWFTHWVAVERDINRRKAAEAAIALNEERFRIVAQATADVVWDWNPGRDILWWNEGMRTLFGYDVASLPHGLRGWTKHIHAEDQSRVVAGKYAALDGDDTQWRDEYRFLRADGSVAIVTDRGFIMRDADGKPVRMVGSMVDVTSQRVLEEKLRQSQRLDAIGQLTGGVAHDFNNLLTVILGNSELLTEGLCDDDALRPLAELTAAAAESAAELTSDLLAFARQQPLDPQRTDIHALLAKMQTLLRRTLGDDIEITLRRGAGVWDALVDVSQLESAILNLCLNARDAMPRGGHLTIEVVNVALESSRSGVEFDLAPGDYVSIAITDTGIGMSPATSSRVFEPFFTTKEVGEGSGLGLSMVFGFAKQSRGHVTIRSELGRGTTVTLFLPRMLKEPGRSEAASVSADVPAARAETVLLVEDNDLVRAHVTRQLESLGYHVVAARGGPEALTQLRARADIDLLFTDVVMPDGMNGRDLADAAKALHPHLPVLFTSGYPEDVIVHQGRLDPGVHLLQKPYRRQDLAAKLRMVIDLASKDPGHGR